MHIQPASQVCLVVLQPHHIEPLVEHLNSHAQTKQFNFRYVTLMTADGRPAQEGSQTSQLRASLLGYKLGCWASLSNYFQNNPEGRWVYLSCGVPEKEQQESLKTVQWQKSETYYSSVMNQVCQLFNLPIVGWTGQVTQELVQVLNEQLSKPKEVLRTWQIPAESLEELASQQTCDRLFGSTSEQRYSLLERLTLEEILRRNGLKARQLLSNKPRLPIRAEVRIFNRPLQLYGLKQNIKGYRGPTVRYGLVMEDKSTEKIDQDQLTGQFDKARTEALLIHVWCSLAFYTKVNGQEPPVIQATVCEDGLLASIFVRYQHGKESYLPIYRYLQQHPFQVRDAWEWETYPYKQIAEDILLANRDYLQIKENWYDALAELASYRQHNREVVCQFGYDGKNVLFKRRNNIEVSKLSLEQTLQKVCLFDDIKVNDLSQKDLRLENRKVIRRIANKYYIYTEGTVDSLEDVEDLLSHSIRKIVMPYPINPDLALKFPKTRLTIGLTLASDDYSMVEAANLQVTPLKKVVDELIRLDLHQSVQVTLNREPIDEEELLKIARGLMLNFKDFGRVYLDSGITSIRGLRCLWRFPTLVPIIGGALWEDQQLIPEIFSEIPNYDYRGQVNCTVLGSNGVIKGNSQLNRKAIQQTCLTRKVHLCQPKGSEILLKKHHDEHTIRKISISCSGTSMLFVCDSPSPSNFCERFDRVSCYRNQSIVKTNLSVINDHIKQKIHSKSYSGVMQNNPGLALAKVMEEFWEIICASNNQQQTNECSDFIVHFLMYINGKGVLLEDIINELNARAYSPQLLPKFSKTNLRDPSIVSLGILNEKYFRSTDKFIEEELGIRIVRPTVSRKLLIEYQISNQEKYDRYFAGKRVSFLPLKSKDMPWMIAFGAIDGCITYNPVMENYPQVSICLHKRQVSGLRISLIKRKGDIIDPKLWNRNNKAIIACEHVNYVHQYFIEQGIDEGAFTLSRIVGSSQSYLITKMNVHFCLCDAVVETGLTLTANDLEEWKTIKQDGDISVGLFMSLKYKV